MFDRVRHDPAFGVELEDEEAAELGVVVPVASSEQFGDFVDLRPGSDSAVERAHTRALGLAASLPTHDQSFVVSVRRAVGAAGIGPGTVLHHSLTEDYEFHVADDGDTTPSHWGGPESSVVGDPSGDSGEMWMCGGEEMERDMWRENLLW